jgi:hypothetical protein
MKNKKTGYIAAAGVTDLRDHGKNQFSEEKKILSLAQDKTSRCPYRAFGRHLRVQ